MKVVFVCPHSYYGDASRGLSYEYRQVAAGIGAAGHEVVHVASTDAPDLTTRLANAVADIQPDVVIYMPSKGEMDAERFAALPTQKAVLLNDDEWRRDWGLFWQQHADFILSTADDGADVYGAKYVPFQWGVNPALYAMMQPEPRHIPMAFYGGAYGSRHQYMGALQQVGLLPDVRGRGFQKENPPTLPEGWNKVRIGIALNENVQQNGHQIKARNFEVPAAGAMLLAEYAPGLERYYEDGKEAVFFTSVEELIDKAFHYLLHDEERNAIAWAGMERTLIEHTYAQRFVPLFERIEANERVKGAA